MTPSLSGGQSSISNGTKKSRPGLHLVAADGPAQPLPRVEPSGSLRPPRGEFDYDELAATLLAKVVSHIANQERRTDESVTGTSRFEQLVRENHALRAEVERLVELCEQLRDGCTYVAVGPQSDLGRGGL